MNSVSNAGTPIKPAFSAAVQAHRAGDIASAEAAYRDLLTTAPALAPAIYNLTALLRSANRWDDAIAVLTAGCTARPGDRELAFALGISLLAAGRYAEAWPLYEHRPAMLAERPPHTRYPMWRGEPIQSLLVWGEQGFGDQIMLARYIPALVARGIAVTIVCKPGLARLFQPLGARVVPAVGESLIAQHGAWTMLGSLPLLFETSLDTIPAPPRLLPRRASGGIGVVTHGRPTHQNDRNRSLDAGAAAALRALGRDLSPAATGAMDFRDTAEIVAGLDLVITVDTAVAHLAGSLGTPVWILLPTIGTDWRWMHGRTDSPWYPTARLFRQRTTGDWSGLLEDVRRALTNEGLIR